MLASNDGQTRAKSARIAEAELGFTEPDRT